MAKTPSGKNNTAPTAPTAPTASEGTVEGKSFETCLSELEGIVSQLESGAKPLEESLALYERGVASLKRCHALLDKAEKRIRMLVRGPNGEPMLREAQLPEAVGRRAEQKISDSEGENVDDETESGQNPPPSMKPASGERGNNEAGGSLFGHTK